MNKYDFINYAAKRYGIDESMAETMVDMFASSLQELIGAGQNITIDEIGTFVTTSLFNKKMVSFKASSQLTNDVQKYH